MTTSDASELTALLTAAFAAAGAIYSAGEDNAGSFTCTEADAIANLLRLTLGDDLAAHFLISHARSDDEGDAHPAGKDAP